MDLIGLDQGRAASPQALLETLVRRWTFAVARFAAAIPAEQSLPFHSLKLALLDRSLARQRSLAYDEILAERMGRCLRYKSRRNDMTEEPCVKKSSDASAHHPILEAAPSRLVQPSTVP